MYCEQRNMVLRFAIFIGVIISLLIWLTLRQTTIRGTAELHFLPLRNADAAIVISGEQVMVIDTGAPEDEQIVLDALLTLGVTHIDMLLLTHPDKDHIGNAVPILQQYSIGQVILPNVKKGSELEQLLLSEIAVQGLPVLQMQQNQKRLALGDCTVQIIPGIQQNYKQTNDASLVAVLSCGNVNTFFGGDVENERIKELLVQRLPRCDIVKVPHHGKEEHHSAELLQKLRPTLCIVTADAAQPQVQTAIEALDSEIAYTPQGGIYIEISNNKWTWRIMDERG